MACFWTSISRLRLQPTTFPPANHRGKYAAPKDHCLTGQLPEEQTRPSTQAQTCTQARGGCRSTGAEAERPASEPCTIDSRGKSTESRETVNWTLSPAAGDRPVRCDPLKSFGTTFARILCYSSVSLYALSSSPSRASPPPSRFLLHSPLRRGSGARDLP